MRKEKDMTYVFHCMGNEGFHYCFEHYSDFDEVKDEEFHKLRKEYLKISEKLEKYVTDKYIEIAKNQN